MDNPHFTQDIERNGSAMSQTPLKGNARKRVLIVGAGAAGYVSQGRRTYGC